MNPQLKHHVIFDGTAARPLGRMLFAPESVTVPRPPEPQHEGPKRRVGIRTGSFEKVKSALASFGDYAFCAKEMAERTHLQPQQVAVALFACVTQGLVQKVGSHPVRYRGIER